MLRGGERPAKDIADDAYWLERAKRRGRAEDKTEFKKKKAQ